MKLAVVAAVGSYTPEDLEHKSVVCAPCCVPTRTWTCRARQWCAVRGVESGIISLGSGGGAQGGGSGRHGL